MHLYHRFKDRFGTAGLIVAVIALIAALSGSAIALTGAEKKEIKKLAKKYAQQFAKAGPEGPPGPAGANGQPGAKGDKGDKGDQGDQGIQGIQGIQGTAGTNGKNVEVGSEATGTGNCSGRGGAWVQVQSEPATKKFVCNGEDGETGFTETLPPGKTETGAWNLVSQASDFGNGGMTAISFPIPLTANIGSNVHFNQPETANCPGNVEEPLAKEGHLCFYQGFNSGLSEFSAFNPEKPGELGVGSTGAVLIAEGEVGTVAWGTWAVTAP
jgi:hypothetical protein